MTTQKNDLLTRTIVGGVMLILLGIFFALSATPIGKWVFVTGVALVAAVGAWEYYQLVRTKGFAVPHRVGITGTVVLVYSVALSLFHPQWFAALPVFSLASICIYCCMLYFSGKREDPITNIATTMFGVLYVGLSLALLVCIRYFDETLLGAYWLIYLLLVTMFTDISALAVGRMIGRTPLARHVSPAKTREGAIGGTIVATVVAVTYTSYFGLLPWWHALWFGALLSVIGQIGDLAESIFKRDAHVKDSNKLPGLGGVLDMVDSLLFAAPVLYLFLRIYYGH